MLDINSVLEEIEELQDEFYGKEEDDFEGGVFEENYECAEWARDNVDGLFATVRRLAIEVNRLQGKIKEKSDRLSEAEDLISEAHDLLDNIHGYDTDVYRAMSKFMWGEDEE